MPFRQGLHAAFAFAIVACLVAAGASWLRGGKYVYHEPASPVPAEPVTEPVVGAAPLP